MSPCSVAATPCVGAEVLMSHVLTRRTLTHQDSLLLASGAGPQALDCARLARPSPQLAPQQEAVENEGLCTAAHLEPRWRVAASWPRRVSSQDTRLPQAAAAAVDAVPAVKCPIAAPPAAADQMPGRTAAARRFQHSWCMHSSRDGCLAFAESRSCREVGARLESTWPARPSPRQVGSMGGS